ncbi:AAA family ATPase [Streptomyces sp. NBC_01788]|uniref:AAA family ATPase n=1 Tax=Streptomyces sp. NBC_01788 TaxID=2975940 RepID=UPI002DDA9ADD|nr:AAA family ATPase [Streptomyces sp. NBC_01788]WSB26053.1 AAA family ATPase [Streptomyces sp. NBC_01788]
MTTAFDLTARVVQVAARILARQPEGHGLAFRQVWELVQEEDPHLEADWHTAFPEVETAVEKRLRYESINLGKAGWLRKTGRQWRLTGPGRKALEELGAGDFLSHARASYGYWDSERAAFEAVTETLAALPDTGKWIRIAALAGHHGLDADFLLPWLQGPRPEGWHLVLGEDGEVPEELGLSPVELDEWRNLLVRDGVYDEPASSASAVRALLDRALEPSELEDLVPARGEAVVEAESPRRAWLVRGDDSRGRSLINGLWQEKGICSVPADRLPTLDEGAAPEKVREVVDEAYSSMGQNLRAQTAAEFHTFLSRMREGDIVVTTDGSDTYLGTITGPARQVSGGGGATLQRAVSWSNLDAPFDLHRHLPREMEGPLGNPDLRLVELTEFTGDLEVLLDEEPDQVPTEGAEAAVLPDATQELADELTMEDPSWLQECVELLRDRPQLIFHGPPGTGKTYTALALARHLTGGREANFRLVQFHPAYSYEDFFEGFRPRAVRAERAEGAGKGESQGRADTGSGIAFDLVEGPLKRLANAARRRPAEVFVLVIDEINRGNLAKVFGELYFLLEYRKEFVHLLYGSDEGRRFRLPPNLVILGTMNTSDRSIALMDAAMRRRFSFMELHPGTDPTASMLSRWLELKNLSQETALLLDALNERIGENPSGDRDFRIGPSYFMRPAVHTGPAALERLWRTQILPLLTDYHWGDDVDITAQYGLASLREELPPIPEPEPAPIPRPASRDAVVAPPAGDSDEPTPAGA